MPTEPRQDVLYRELSQIQANELNKVISPLLQEVINFATNVFIRCMSYSEGDENVDLAPFALYRHIMELSDGIEVLLSNACPVPAIPLLRSSFEALLSLEFITEDTDLYERRSLTWLASYVRKRLAVYESLSDLQREVSNSWIQLNRTGQSQISPCHLQSRLSLQSRICTSSFQEISSVKFKINSHQKVHPRAGTVYLVVRIIYVTSRGISTCMHNMMSYTVSGPLRLMLRTSRRSLERASMGKEVSGACVMSSLPRK